MVAANTISGAIRVQRTTSRPAAETVVNLKTAKALGRDVFALLQQRANEVIE